jgi:hypothetical protein
LSFLELRPKKKEKEKKVETTKGNNILYKVSLFG